MRVTVSKSDLEIFKTFLSRFEICEPIKSLFSPVFQVVYSWSHDESQVSLMTTAPDSLGVRPQVGITLMKPIPKHLLASPSIYTPANYDQLASQFLREMIWQLLQHEADESIRLDGRQIFNPHPEIRGDGT